ncbi:MAG: UTRA domain-containing protein [Rhodobacteraceae bacterium]|nr:UTRA domain-containing protein [Paracoccaceae bacterium]
MQATKKATYQHVRDEVVNRIQNRDWPPGAILPTEVELAKEFGCARATVNRAMRELAEQGIVDRKRKSGTRVVVMPVKQAKLEITPVRQSVEEQNGEYRYNLVRREILPCPDWLASKLALPARSPVMYLQCMHYGDNQPFQFEERWINIAAVPKVVEADLETLGPGEWLLREVPFTDAEIVFSAVAADKTLSEFLGTPVGSPVFQMERTTWFQGQPVTLVRFSHHPGYRMSTRY